MLKLCYYEVESDQDFKKKTEKTEQIQHYRRTKDQNSITKCKNMRSVKNESRNPLSKRIK